MNPHVYAILIVSACIFCVFLCHWAWKDNGDIIEDHFQKDYERRRFDIQQSPFDADAIIDDFENRWASYIVKSRLRYYIGKLIEVHLKSMTVAGGH